jgi:predicted secreted protein
MRALFLSFLVSLCTCASQAQPVADWLTSSQAAEFRERVIQLALIYGESSGIDLQGFQVLARETGNKDAGCADVEVVTSKGNEEVRRESVRACKK